MQLVSRFRKYHKWLALIIGVQALIWVVSGLYMTAVHIDFVHGDHLVKPQKKIVLSGFNIRPLPAKLLSSKKSETTVHLSILNGTPVYLIKNKNKVVRINAVTQKIMPPPDTANIKQIASSYYAGKNKIVDIQLLPRYPSELGGSKKPIWQVQYDDWLDSTLYILPETGQLRSKRSDLWRWFDFLWMLHIMDYSDRVDTNNTLLRFASATGLLMALCGFGLLFYSFKKVSASNSFRSSAPLIVRRVHKWLALFVGLQLVIWMLSGFSFSLIDKDKISGGKLVQFNQSSIWSGRADDLLNIIKRYAAIQSIDSETLLEKPIYRVKTLKNTFIVNADNFNKIVLDDADIRNIAEKHFVGKGAVINLAKEKHKTLENRKFPLPLWRVDFTDDENSSLYFKANTGQFVGIKTDSWRLFDIFWMLHIMDYTERDDMNNALVIFIASLSCFIAISGIWLLFIAFSKTDFNLMARFKRVPVVIHSESGFNSEIFAIKNSRLMDTLAQSGYQLPSNCGGGGVCGLCKVKVDATLPVSASDKNMFNPQQLDDGMRLACQLSLTEGVEVELPASVLHQQLISCKVLSNKFKTPLIKELILALPVETHFEFKPGEYVLFHIPPGVTQLDKTEVPEQYQSIWSTLELNQSRRTETITRAYSMANPPGVLTHDRHQQLVFTIRLSLPENPSTEPGKASSFLFMLKPNDSLNISGPFGHFHAVENTHEMIFIGGGAGMAPLRAHILYQLETIKTSRKISFWYGARNEKEIFYKDSFDNLQSQHPNFSWNVAISDSDDSGNWSGYKGMIHEILAKHYLNSHANISECDCYICGPSAMNRAVLSLLSDLGVPESNIHIDDFGG